MNLDKFIKNKLENQNIAFQPQFWEAAEQLIVQQEKQKRNKKFVYLTVLALLFSVSIGTFGLFNYFEKSNQKVLSENESKENSELNKFENTIELSKKPIYDTENLDENIPNPNELSTEDYAKQILAMAQAGLAKYEPDNQANDDNTFEIINQKTSLNEDNKSTGTLTNQDEEKSENVILTNQNVESSFENSVENQIEENNSSLVQNSSTEISNILSENTFENFASNNQELNIENQENKSGPPSFESENSEFASDNSNSIPLQHLDDIAQKNQDNSEFLEPNNVSVSNKTKSKKDFFKPVKSFGLFMTKNLTLVAGGNILQNWTDNNSTNGFGLSPTFGFNYSYDLWKDNLSLKTGLQYANRQSLKNSFNQNSTTYSFGYTRQNTIVETKKLNFIEIPVVLNYKIKSKHEFSTGIIFSQLTSAKSKVEIFEENSLGAVKTENKTQFLKADGYRSEDLALVFGYHYYIKNNLSVNLNFRYGLRDMTDNNYFQNETFNRTLGTQLTIEFTPFLNKIK